MIDTKKFCHRLSSGGTLYPCQGEKCAIWIADANVPAAGICGDALQAAALSHLAQSAAVLAAAVGSDESDDPRADA